MFPAVSLPRPAASLACVWCLALYARKLIAMLQRLLEAVLFGRFCSEQLLLRARSLHTLLTVVACVF
jgi:hypothetical protein